MRNSFIPGTTAFLSAKFWKSAKRQPLGMAKRSSASRASGRPNDNVDGKARAGECYTEELDGPCYVSETVVKKSRFIACAGPAPSVRDALSFVTATSEADARHNCWAFRVGSDVSRSSDDGEPSGTAGKPILAAIDRSGLSHVVVVVVRYFGGIKLGASGLTRAYGNAASTCLNNAPRRRSLITKDVRIHVPHSFVGNAVAIVNAYTIIDVEYSDLSATIIARVPANELEAIGASLQNATKGQAIIG